MVYIVLDTETRGLHKRPLADLNKPLSLSVAGDSVVQLGAIVLNRNFEIQRSFCLYNNIIFGDINPQAKEVNKLSMDRIRYKLSSVTLEQNLVQYLPEIFSRDVCLVGANIYFDFTMIAQTIRNFAQFEPFENYRKLSAPRSGRKLVDVAEYFATSIGSRRVYKRLAQASEPYKVTIQNTFAEISKSTITNLPEEFYTAGNQYHSALYDAVATYVLWREKVCPTWI